MQGFCPEALRGPAIVLQPRVSAGFPAAPLGSRGETSTMTRRAPARTRNCAPASRFRWSSCGSAEDPWEDQRTPRDFTINPLIYSGRPALRQPRFLLRQPRFSGKAGFPFNMCDLCTLSPNLKPYAQTLNPNALNLKPETLNLKP